MLAVWSATCTRTKASRIFVYLRRLYPIFADRHRYWSFVPIFMVLAKEEIRDNSVTLMRQIAGDCLGLHSSIE